MESIFNNSEQDLGKEKKEPGVLARDPKNEKGMASVTPTSSSSGGTATATATVRSFYDQAKETAGQAYEKVTDKAADKLDEQKVTISEGLSTVADSVRKVSDDLGTADSGLAEKASKYTSTAARKIEDAAGYLETRNVRDMARDLEGFARRNPALFIGAAFGLGFLAARFLKSTPPSYKEAHAGAEFAAAESAPSRSRPKGAKVNLAERPL